MNNNEAKEILKLYRPGTADTDDSSFAEALALCERDAELEQWFKEHCAVYAALRTKFKQIPVPEGLKEQIIAERKVHTTPGWQKGVLVAGAVAVLAMIVFGVSQLWTPSEPTGFAAYRDSMASYASRGYGMQKETSDLNDIREFLATQPSAITNYVLPANLQKNAKAAGCVAMTWRNKKVSMICFQTGRPLAPGNKSDLWLMIADNTVAEDAPKATAPKIEHIDDLVTASWTVGNRTYVLATRGDDELIRKFLKGEKTEVLVRPRGSRRP